MIYERQILHSDLNNFYASVECLLNPKLRNCGVAVCGKVEDRHGIVLAKNQIAKGYGVKTGDTVWQARQKCRDIVIVEPNFGNYVKYSKLVKEIYSRYTDQIEPYGMDECWLDVTGSKLLFGSGEEIAHKIRNDVKNELGLTVSIGVSFNKIFAKLGSDMKKPDAVTVISQSNFKNLVWQLPARELLGVGSSTGKVLNKYFIKTIGDLANTNPDLLKHHLGKNGVQLYNFANGLDNSAVLHQEYISPIKSIGHGITTVKDLTCDIEVWHVILELVQDIAKKLRKQKKYAGAISIRIKENNLSSKQWQTTLNTPTKSALMLAKASYDLFKKSYIWNNDIRAITVTAINLVDDYMQNQSSFFIDSNKLCKLENLDCCVDSIKSRFGKKSIMNASLFLDIKFPEKENEITMPTGMSTVI